MNEIIGGHLQPDAGCIHENARCLALANNLFKFTGDKSEPVLSHHNRIKSRTDGRAYRGKLGGISNDYQLAVGSGIDILKQIVQQASASKKR